MRSTTRFALAAASILGLSEMHGAVGNLPRTVDVTASASRMQAHAGVGMGQVQHAPRPGDAGWARWWARKRHSSTYYPVPGHTVRHGQRLARKARNQARNRSAHRGRA